MQHSEKIHTNMCSKSKNTTNEGDFALAWPTLQALKYTKCCNIRYNTKSRILFTLTPNFIV